MVFKDGPAGTYNFMASATTGSTTTLDQGPVFTLTAGGAALECARVASTTVGGQNVTVTEVPPLRAGTEFEKITRYRFFTGNGFELHCDLNDLPNTLEVNWPDNRFHLTELTSVVCTDDPALHPLPRKAGFDTYTASGVGLWNGQPGATIDFVFTDDGEPGRKDHATMTITPPGGSPVTVSGFLRKGNHQAHWVN